MLSLAGTTNDCEEDFHSLTSGQSQQPQQQLLTTKALPSLPPTYSRASHAGADQDYVLSAAATAPTSGRALKLSMTDCVRADLWGHCRTSPSFVLIRMPIGYQIGYPARNASCFLLPEAHPALQKGSNLLLALWPCCYKLRGVEQLNHFLTCTNVHGDILPCHAFCRTHLKSHWSQFS